MNRMGFFNRLLGRQQDGAALGSSRVTLAPSKRQQPSSPATGSFAPDCFGSRSAPAAVKLQSVQQADAEADSDDEDTIRVPGSMSVERQGNRSSSLSRRRVAIDISPAAVQRLADKVAILEAGQLRASLDEGNSGVTHTEIEQLYTDMQLIHRGRSSMVYRARESRSGQRVILKAYDASRLTPTKRGYLERQVRTLKAAQALLGAQGGVVRLERLVENPAGTYLVLQACNGGTLIEAMANSGGKLPERQVAIKVALPMLKALARLHAKGIVHRDIKPEHLMIHNGNLKIGDFGNAGSMWGENAPGTPKQQQTQPGLPFLSVDGDQQADQLPALKVGAGSTTAVSVTVAAGSGSGLTDMSTVTDAAAPKQQQQQSGGALVRDAMNYRCGSIEYMAPEMLDKPTAAEVFHLVIAQGIDEDDMPEYTSQVDIWSLGVVLYEALTGVQPFLAANAADMAAVIGAKLSATGDSSMAGSSTQLPQHRHQQQQFPPFIDRLPVSADGKAFIAACLTWDPRQRPGAAELLQHRWLAAMQEQAAAVAASRAASRRVSLASMSGAAGAASRPQPAGVPPAMPSYYQHFANEAPAAAGNSATPLSPTASGSNGALVDELLADALLAMPTTGGLGGVSRPSAGERLSLDGDDEEDERGLYRSRTTANLEVGVRSMMRSNTQRLEARLVTPRVHAP